MGASILVGVGECGWVAVVETVLRTVLGHCTVANGKATVVDIVNGNGPPTVVVGAKRHDFTIRTPSKTCSTGIAKWAERLSVRQAWEW